jgi:CheY-like chemotaxis protein
MSGDRAAKGSPEFILICDDEARLASLTAGLLEDYGYQLATVQAGEEALEVVRAGSPPVGVLLLDVNLSTGMAAEEVLAAMGRERVHPRVVLTSGLAQEDVPEALLADPLVTAYLPKPYSVEDLLEAVRRASGAPPTSDA